MYQEEMDTTEGEDHICPASSIEVHNLIMATNSESEEFGPVETGTSEEEEIENGSTMMNPSVAEIVLLNTLGFLDTVDIVRASKVSRLWHAISMRKIFWRKVKTKRCRVVNIEGMVDMIKRQGTRNLDLRETIFPLYSAPSPPHFWLELFYHLKSATTIVNLDLGMCSPVVTHLVRLGNLRKTVKKLNTRFASGSGNLVDITPLHCMDLIALDMSVWSNSIELMNVHQLKPMVKIQSFALSAWSSPETAPPFGLGRSLFKELPLLIVPGMKNLRKLLLRDRISIFISNELISAISQLEHLEELDLINCSVDRYFEVELAKCTRLRALTIAPTNFDPRVPIDIPINIHQQVVTAAINLRDTLDYFRLGIYEKSLLEIKRYVKEEMDDVSFVRYVQQDEILAIPFSKSCKCTKQPCRFEYHLDFILFKSLRDHLSQAFGRCQTEVIKIRLPAPQFQM